MEKKNLNQLFAERLKQSMVEAGHNSDRSTSGVSIHKLADITGYSLQICRKYLRGDIIPEPSKLLEIANTLGVSAGWLLFGTESTSSLKTITLSKTLLAYIFEQLGCVYDCLAFKNKAGEFLLNLVDDISQLEGINEKQLKSMVDIAFAPLKHLNVLKKSDEVECSTL